MSTSNTLTKNDLKKVLEKLSIGSGGVIDADDMTQAEIDDFLEDINAQGRTSEYRKLLWTNPSPTSSFAAQTISLDLSDYDEVEIEAKQLASGSIIQLCRVGIGKQTKCLFRDGNANNFYTRTFVTSTSSVQFGDAYYNATLTNTDCVPTTIYGIKYEKVAPIQVNASDYVIEQGTSDIWTYRKWESGVAECWGRTSISGLTTSINLPFAFADSSYETQVTLINNSNTATNVTAITSYTGSVSIGVNTVPSGGARLFIIGRWK